MPLPKPKKGERVPGSGRKPGTPNRETQNLREICEKHGVNPFEGMVIIAAAELDPDKKFDKLERLCQYIEPKRKALEVSADFDPELIEVAKGIAELPKDELLKIIAAELRKLK